MRLRWCEAEKAHEPALKAFICTDPPKREWDRWRGKHHPREWELEIQAYIHKLRPPFQLPYRVLLGFDDSEKLLAVIMYDLLNDCNQVFVRGVACAHEARGNAYAGDAYEAMFEDIRGLGWTHDFEVEGNVHVSNTASKRAFARIGGAHVRTEGKYETWRLQR